MLEDVTREKTSRGELKREDCDEENARKFLCLSKRRPIIQVIEVKQVSEEEFRVVVKISKRRSTSSTFSKIDFSTCKCAMNCELITKVLLISYDVMLKCNHFPSRQLDVLDAMIEKVKVNVINKLRNMQKIEVDLQLLMGMFQG